jgi:1-acyl-sn-glycerol-3-phosphate acyltransferase
MKLMLTFVSWAIRKGSRTLIHIDPCPFDQVPERGPLIVVVNHIGSVEVPLLAAHLRPRKTIALAKIETWNNKFMGWLFDLWEAIPIRRGEADLDAIRQCLAVLDGGDILVVAPEGTRSYNGHLKRGQPGVSLIALRSGAPILPIVHWGGENFTANIKHLDRTDFHLKVGKPFRLVDNGAKVTGKTRQEMADEIMYQLAALMPEEYRGEYKDCNPPPMKYLHFA